MNLNTFFVETIASDAANAKRHRIRLCAHASLRDRTAALSRANTPFFQSFLEAQHRVQALLEARELWLQAQTQQVALNRDEFEQFYAAPDNLLTSLDENFRKLVAALRASRLSPGQFQVGELQVDNTLRHTGADSLYLLRLPDDPAFPQTFDDSICSLIARAMGEVEMRITRQWYGKGQSNWTVLVKFTR